MGHDHSHGHSHADARDAGNVGRLRIALGLTFLYMIAEAVGGWLTNSLALIADAGHMLTDVAAMALTLFAFSFASRPANARKTYGYYRLEILAAFVNGVTLVVLSIWVIYEAIQRWWTPPEVMGPQLLMIAAGGLIVNLISAFLLHSGQQHNVNMRGAFLHVIGDLLGSVAAIVAGLLIIFAGWMWADPAASILISVIIIIGAWRLVGESVDILLEGTPAHIDIGEVERSLRGSAGVLGVHDLHIWTISSGLYAMSVHISHDSTVRHAELMASLRETLQHRFGIDHLTIQMENAERESEAIYVCETGTKCFEPAGGGADR